MALTLNKDVKNPKQAMAVKIGTSKSSERYYANAMVACVERGLLKVGEDISKKNYQNCLNLIDEQKFVNRGDVILSSSSYSAAKLVSPISTGCSHSPMAETSAASRRERLAMLLVNTVMEILDIKGYKRPHVYHAVLSMVNCDMGELKEQLDLRSNRASSVMREFRRHSDRDSKTLRFVTFDGDNAKFFGATMSNEITENDDCLKHRNPHGLYHPHTHAVLVTDKALDVEASRDVLFKYWEKRNPGLKIDKKACFLKPVYGSDSLRQSVLQATDYVVKPSYLKSFADMFNGDDDVKDDFALRAFAEVQHAIQGFGSKRSNGVWEIANGFVNFLMDPYNSKTIGSAVLAGAYKGRESDSVPSIMTKIGVHRFTKESYRFTSSQLMSKDMLLWANRDLLNGVHFEIPDNLKWPKNNAKADLYRKLLERMMLPGRGKEGLLCMIDTWDRSMQKAHDDLVTSKNISERKFREDLSKAGVEPDPDDPTLLSPVAQSYQRKLDRVDSKLFDIRYLREAVDELVDVNGRYYIKANYRLRLQLVSMFECMRGLDKKYPDQSWDNRHNPSRKESIIVSQFLTDNKGHVTTKYLPLEVLSLYKLYLKLGQDKFVSLIIHYNDSELRQMGRSEHDVLKPVPGQPGVGCFDYRMAWCVDVQKNGVTHLVLRRVDNSNYVTDDGMVVVNAVMYDVLYFINNNWQEVPRDREIQSQSDMDGGTFQDKIDDYFAPKKKKKEPSKKSIDYASLFVDVA